MRIVLALLMCWGVAFGQDTTKYFKSVDYGWNWQRGKFRGGLILPTDTTNNKLGIAQIGATCFAWSGLKWNSIGSTDTSFLVRYYRKNQVDSAIAANYPALTLQDVTTNGKTTTDSIIAASFKRTGGTSSQFLKANGSVDNNTYLNKADSIAGGYYPYSSNPKGYLTSVTGYVPYTGATSDVDLGLFALNAASVKINGTNGNGHLHLRHQASDATATGQSTVLFANSNGDLKWKNAGNYYTTLQTYKNNADRVYTYQNKSYTLADSTTLVDSVSALRTSINTKGSGTVTSLTLGRGLTGSSPITTTGTIGLDTTRNYTWSGFNTFNPSVSGASSIGVSMTPANTTTANSQIHYGLKIAQTLTNSGNYTNQSRALDVSIGTASLIFGDFNSPNLYSNTNNEPSLFINRTSSSGWSNLYFSNTFQTAFLAGLRFNPSGELRLGTFLSGGYTTIMNNTTEVARFTGGNLILQNGGTFTDAGDRLQVNGNLNLTTAGNKIKMVSSSNTATATTYSSGTTTLISGTITVTTTSITASSNVILTLQNCSNCGTVYLNGRTAGTSFTIASTNILDGSLVYWEIRN